MGSPVEVEVDAMSGRLRRGLTLWEVLAAASGMLLIAFIGALVLPVQHREIDHRRVCTTNARMLSMAVRMYVDDYDRKLPPIGYAAGGQFHGLPSLLDAYIKDGNVWCCPDALRRGDRVHRYAGDPADTTVSYGYNWLALAPNSRGIRVDQVQSSGETVLFAETTSYLVIPTRLASTHAGTVPMYAHSHRCTVTWLSGRTSYSPSIELEHISISASRQTREAGIDAYRFWNRR
jgi:hypothetical protein